MSLFDSARFRLSVSQLDGLPAISVPEIAFVGRSNAGKSTTINVLTRQGRLAFASKTPGRTQLINFFSLSKKNENGQREHVADLVDLPGYGFAKAAESTRKTWSALIGGYLAHRDTLTGIVVVMDARRPFMPTDEWVIDFMNTRPVRLHFLLNKADQLNNQGKINALRQAQCRASEIGPHVSVQLFSGLKKEGVAELREVLTSWIYREERTVTL
ncbi:MAG TPA: YihA family ribosome biogenesis GTP-binding protein [Candidatus Aphodousia faecipullorum]|nr:YihA family ribosome biogenesis GTP-binding protein [Candidatus Aphodousia faecipullorum]